MVEAMLAYEAKRRKELRTFEEKVAEVVAQKKEQLDKKALNTLKEMCASKGLPVGGGKEERIERLVDEAKKDGDVDKLVSKNLRNKRKEELMSMDKPAVVQLCEKLGVDPIVKDILVERIMMHESEGGAAIAMTDMEPAAKRARKK